MRLQAPITLIAVLLAVCPAARSERIDLSRHWDISTAAQKNTAFRKKICLNGFWQFSALSQSGTEPSGQWGYMKVPGGTRMQFVVHDADRKVDPEATEKMATSPFALYRRTFRLDETFAGKKIYLYVAYLWHTGTIYVNGQQIATIVPAESIAKRTVDITDAVRIGAENEVKILVCNEPVEKPKTQKDHQAGICDDVWLLAGPAGPRIEKLRVWTSVENRKLHMKLRLSDVAGRKLTVSGTVLEHLTRRGKSGRTVLQIPSQRLRFGAVRIAEVEVDLSPHWDELRLWNFEDPALYDLVLDLAADGDPVDQVAQRIGLRETKIIAHQFYLNGKLTHARDLYKFFEKHSRRRYAQVADVRAFRKYVRLYKRAGWNLAHSFSAYEPYLDTVLDVMDEEGLMYYPLIMGVSGYRSIKKDPQMFRKITEAIDHFGNHPSVIFWSMFTTGGFRTEESIRNPWAWTLDYGPKYPTNRSKQVREGHEAFFEHIRKCDPTRPVMFGTLSNFGQAITGFYYPNFGTPIQEIESWPVKWFVAPVRKAHWTLESTFYYLACWADQKLWKHKSVWAEQVYENAARSLGPKAYTSGANVDPSPNIRPFLKHPRPGDRLVGQTIMHTGHNPVYLERMNHFATRVMRSWRAYDIACCGLGDELAIMYDVFRTDGERQLAVHPDYRMALEELKTAGPKVDTVQTFERFINLTEPKLPFEAPPSDIYESMRENATGPFLAFIAHDNGKLGSFTRKDHAYASGRQIAKNIVLINDHAEPRKVSFQVRFGRSVIKEGGMLMQPGHIQLVHISLKAPQVKVRTEFKIELTAEIAPGLLADLSDNVVADIVNSFPAKRTDSFAVQVFPDAATKIDAPDLKIALYDEGGHTGELMKKANLSFTPLKSGADLKGCDLLVVGRDSFTDKFRLLAAEMDLESQVSSGACDMLIFEQGRSRCAFDRELINASARRTFIADKTHPAVAGLTDDDMADWRGDTDLQAPAPPVMGYMRPGTPYFPKWTNEGVVSSFPLSKPEYGNFRVIVDCWFDLGFAALFEAFCGSGSVMFCQLDVTNHRFGTDPAATRIVRNLFAYYAGRASGAKVDPFGPVWRLQGDARAEKLLTDRGVKSVLFCPEAAGGTLVIVGGASDAANVADYVAGSGKVLYLIDAAGGVDSSLLPGGVSAQAAAQVVYELVGADPIMRGISQADLHFKGSPTLLAVTSGKALTEASLICRLDHGRGFYLFAPWMNLSALEGLTLLAAPKLERLWSTLLTNLGVAQTGVSVAPRPPAVAKPHLLVKWDFETANRDGIAPFNSAELLTGGGKAGGGKRCIKSKPLRKTWCAVGIPDVRLPSGSPLYGDVYLSFKYRLNKPTWLLVSLTGDGHPIAKRIEADEGGKWVGVCFRLDRFEGYPPQGLGGDEAALLEFFAGDPDQTGLELRIDDVAFYSGPPPSDVAPPYIPLLTRCPYRYYYDPDSYVRW